MRILATNRIPGGSADSADAFAACPARLERLGGHLADRGNPAFTRTTAGNCGPGTVLGGYTLITAGTLEEAAALAADHPLIFRGGGVEVAELTLLTKGRRPVTEQPAPSARPSRGTPTMPKIAAFAVMSPILTVTPGPDSLLVLRSSLLGGRRTGARVAGGAASESLAWGI